MHHSPESVNAPCLRRNRSGLTQTFYAHTFELQAVGGGPVITRGGKQGPASELGEQITHLGLGKPQPPQNPGGLTGKGTAPGEHRHLLVPSLVTLGQI